MKNNLPFYQHYSNSDQHPKFKMLRVEFGWSGEGKFWALNNRIAQADNCCLDVSKKYNKAAIASDLSLSLKEFDSFINFLLHDCELIMECEPGVITTDIVQENFDRVSKDRASARERSRKRWGNSTVSSPEKDKSSPEHLSKVKESKVKEKKEELYTPIFLEFWKLYPKKVGKGDAFKSFGKIKKPKPSIEDIIKSIQEHQKTKQWETLQFIPNPATWINQRRWEDEINENDMGSSEWTLL